MYKKREKPYKMQVLESLNARINLSEEEYNDYLKQVKGYEGECYFDTLIGDLPSNCLILNDLSLEVSGTEFQIDALIITAREIMLYEVKNYGGEYIYKEGFLVSISSGNSFHSPTDRINRHTSLLQSLLEVHQINLPIQSFVAFVHPEFMLYDVSTMQKTLVRTTLPKHLRKLNARPEVLSPAHFLLAKTLCEISSKAQPYLKGVPEYTYEMCTKGIICSACEKFIPKIEYKCKNCLCKSCGHKELVSDLVSRHVLEYKRLFPDRKLTISTLYDWCGGVCAERRIRLVLQKEYQTANAGRALHYI